MRLLLRSITHRYGPTPVLDGIDLALGEGEILADLIVAAHADAKRKLDEQNNALMREAAGPMAGMNIPGMPKLF